MDKESNRIRLWTIQSDKSIKELKENGKLLVNWSRYYENDYFKEAYKWMSEKMKEKGVSCERYAPIWLWYSIEGSKQTPTLEIARNLLSDVALELGVKTIEILYPIEKGIVFSNYSVWNEILDKFSSENKTPKIESKLAIALFNVDIKKHSKIDLIQQATIPIIKSEWVVDIRNLNLKPNNFNYDVTEEI